MTAQDLFLHLTAAGGQLTRQGDTLRVHDPQHVLTDDLRQTIREHKAALLGMLDIRATDPTAARSGACWRCKGPSERQGLRYLLCCSSARWRPGSMIPSPPDQAHAAGEAARPCRKEMWMGQETVVNALSPRLCERTSHGHSVPRPGERQKVQVCRGRRRRLTRRCP